MFDLPKLLNMVFSLLLTQDLAHCTLVNKHWCDVVTPHLWCTISYLMGNQQNAIQRMVLKDCL